LALFHWAENPKSTHVKSCTLLPQRYVHLLLELTEVVRKKAEEQRSKVENTSGSSANHLLKEAEVLEASASLVEAPGARCRGLAVGPKLGTLLRLRK
jgi:hypothetical protein